MAPSSTLPSENNNNKRLASTITDITDNTDNNDPQQHPPQPQPQPPQPQGPHPTRRNKSSLLLPSTRHLPGHPMPKRRRVAENARVRSAKACQRCRRLKEKCDGQQPCERCERCGQSCEFAPTTTSAGERRASSASVKPEGGGGSGGGYRELRATTSYADSVRLEERTKCMERILRYYVGHVSLDLNSLRRMAEKTTTATRRDQYEGVDGEGVGGEEEEDDLTLEDENFTVKTLSQSTAHYSGEFSHWNFSQNVRRTVNQCLESRAAAAPPQQPPSSTRRNDLRSNNSNNNNSHHPMPPAQQPQPRPNNPQPPLNWSGVRIREYWRATQLQSPKTLVQSVILNHLPPTDVALFLVDMYFKFAQVNCFFVEEAWLRQKLEFLYEAGPGHVTSEDSAWVCSVLMVLAIGTQFAHMKLGPPGDDTDSGEEYAGGVADKTGTSVFPGDDDADKGVALYQTASKLIPDMITIASMESVRAFLLLAHYVLPLDTQGLSYTYLGLGMKMAIQNGMHRRYIGTDLDAWTIETRNRLWWTVYTVERRVSVLHGRPASIAATEVDAELPKDMPEFRPHGDVSTFANMSHLIEMTLRLGDVANAITLLRRCPKNLQHTYFERIVDICQALRGWWNSLPSTTRDPTPASPTFRANAHLKLTLLLNDIFVGRPFILSHTSTTTTTSTSAVPSSSSPGSVSSPGGTSSVSSGDRPRNRTALATRAVEAAMSAITLLQTLHATTGLARSSYTEFSSCRAALLVMLAQRSVARGGTIPHLAEAIDVGMRLIRRMAAAGNVSTQSETSVIEALEIAVRRLHEMQVREEREQGVGGGVEAEVVDGGQAIGREVFRGDGRSRSHEEMVEPGKSGYERFREWASIWPPHPHQHTHQHQHQHQPHQPSHHSHHHPQQGDAYAHSAAASSTIAPHPHPNPPTHRFAPEASKTPPSFGMPPAGLHSHHTHPHSHHSHTNSHPHSHSHSHPPSVMTMGAARHGEEHSPESARWLSMIDPAMGVGFEQLDDLGLFGGFPELGALDGWAGLG